ncbi:hypothetical protein PsAD2_01949 [Pseudovibrio axinellae]|uniref:Uncharacterized protein n=1 Tax=Pseudovibrio axinellae TaxID=989403 RepID=A0A165Z0U5_9HYPH|nr:hypothetical protein [Pseudovibrio axinellae]KZL19410.1 hypothetical protein PsAD2_01949 [Pseudovibrio axinellae]SER59167.1 hypothetical protein SAMN05421798_11347 [Pseudovibrio axinellae]
MQEQASGNSTGLTAGQIEIFDKDSPALPSGSYVLSVQQSVSHDGTCAISPSDGDQCAPYETSLDFAVEGPKLSMGTDQVMEVFPPSRSPGAWQETLPYISLASPSIPWESTIAIPQSSTNGDTAPWLALVVLTQEELGNLAQPVHTITVGDLISPSSQNVLAPVISPSPTTQERAEKISSLDIPAAVFTANMPSAADMKLLAHVRRTSKDDGTQTSETGTDTYSIIMANRLPQPAKNNFAFLISLEGLGDYLPGGSKSIPEDKTSVRVAVLYSWQLGTVTEESDFCSDFQRLAEGDNTSMLKLPQKIEGQVGTVLELGYVPLTWHMRSGETMTGWYRGPFTPVATKEDLIQPPKDSAILPAVLHSDQLLRYDQSTGTFDVSYAAAFEVGRLLALSTPSYLTQISGWRADAITEALKSTGNLYHDARALLSEGQAASSQEPPVSIQNWLARQAQLTGLPFSYLVPSADLLMTESLRFFILDQNWIYYFLMGALSVGILEDSSLAHHQGSAHSAVTKAMKSANNGEGWVEPITGYLLRSSLVTDFPKMTVSARAVDGNALVCLQKQNLSSAVTFGLFYGVPETVSFTQPEQHQQFGVYVQGSGYVIPARYISGAKTGSKIPSDGSGDASVQVAMRAHSNGVLDVSATAQSLAAIVSANDDYLQASGALSSGQFAVQMIKPAGQFSFSWSPTSQDNNTGEAA